MEPCGTPQFRLPGLENDSFIFTLKVLSVKYDLNHEMTLSEKFRYAPFFVGEYYGLSYQRLFVNL